VTRIYTPGKQKLRIRYKNIEPPLGLGQFGIVYKCIDVDLGKFIAVKILKRP
jgi:serine/threonine protein kinase